MEKPAGQSLFVFLFACTGHRAKVQVVTLNGSFFSNHPGFVDEQEQVSLDPYNQKFANLATLMKQCEVVELQETGGEAEISELATEHKGTVETAETIRWIRRG